MRLLNLLDIDFSKVAKVIGSKGKVNSTIDNFLTGLGFEYLAHGGYAAVYLKDEKIFKIFSHDKVYESYLNILDKIPKQYKKFSPRIKSHDSFNLNKKIKIVEIEKLKDIPKEYRKEQSFDDLKKLLDDREFIKHVKSNSLDTYFEEFSTGKNTRKIIIFLGIEFIRYLVWLKQELSLEDMDIHYVNIMMRDNTPVFIDP